MSEARARAETQLAKASKPVVRAVRAESTEPVIDGVAEDSAWLAAPIVSFDTDYSGKHVGIPTQARFVWSSHALFAFFEISETSLNVDQSYPKHLERTGLYNEDCVEIFVGPEARLRHHYYEIELGPLGHWFDLEIDHARKLEDIAWSGKLQIATTYDAAKRTATIEVKIAAAEIVQALKPRAELPLAIYRMEGKTARQYLAWSPPRTVKPSFHVPEAFGTLRLDER